MEEKIRILIADSGEDYRKLLAEMLENEGDFEVIGGTGDGRAALEMIDKKQPDVVLTDLILSGTDGLGVMERIAAMPEKQRPKVIVISGFYSDAVIASVVSLGAAYFMHKPCDIPTLMERVRFITGRAGPVPAAADVGM